LGYNVCASKKAISNKNFREKAINNLTQLIENEEYHCRSKNGFTGVFSRDRTLTFKIVVLIIMRGIKRSVQRELDSFFKEVHSGDFDVREVTKGAFTQARAKLKHEAFIEMNDNVNDTFYKEAPYLVWHHMRLLAADGTRLALPKHHTVVAEFGEHGFGPNADSKQSLAIGSFLYDCLNLVTVDAQIGPYSSSEGELLDKHLDKVKQGDLLLLDRGYPSYALLFKLAAKGVQSCVRMKEDWWLQVKEFKDSGQKDAMVELCLPKKDRHLLGQLPELQSDKLTCRFIRIELDNGQTEILCTSLIDQQRYTYEDMAELYHFRWTVEEGYKLFKSRAEIESFSGKTALAVKQEFYAGVFTLSLCAVLAFPIEELVRKQSAAKGNKHQSKINRTSALAQTKRLTIPIFLQRQVDKAIGAFDKLMFRTTEIIRPGRRFERRKKLKKPYNMVYKQL